VGPVVNFRLSGRGAACYLGLSPTCLYGVGHTSVLYRTPCFCTVTACAFPRTQKQPAFRLSGSACPPTSCFGVHSWNPFRRECHCSGAAVRGPDTRGGALQFACVWLGRLIVRYFCEGPYGHNLLFLDARQSVCLAHPVDGFRLSVLPAAVPIGPSDPRPIGRFCGH
jgi:hypothetical protein